MTARMHCASAGIIVGKLRRSMSGIVKAAPRTYRSVPVSGGIKPSLNHGNISGRDEDSIRTSCTFPKTRQSDKPNGIPIDSPNIPLPITRFRFFRKPKPKTPSTVGVIIAVLEFLCVMQVGFSTPGMALATRSNWWRTSFLMSFFAQ